jgi:hypothetical protein
MTDRWWMAAAVIALLAVVAGCGSDDEDSGSSGEAASGGAARAGATAGTDVGPAGAGGDAGDGSSQGGAGGDAGDGSSQGGAGGDAGDGSGQGEAGGDAGDGGGAGEPLAISGEYADEFATSYVITDSTWTQTWGDDTSVFNITQYDNDGQCVVAQNDSDNTFKPNLWSRFNWTHFDSALWICQRPYDAPSEAAALATARPDDSDPSAVGSCDVGTWSRLTEVSIGSAGAGGQAGQAGSGGGADLP